MKVWIVTFAAIEAVVAGYETADDAAKAAVRAYAAPIIKVEEVTGPTIIFRELGDE
jgi:hypothetical protein